MYIKTGVEVTIRKLFPSNKCWCCFDKSIHAMPIPDYTEEMMDIQNRRIHRSWERRFRANARRNLHWVAPAILELVLLEEAICLCRYHGYCQHYVECHNQLVRVFTNRLQQYGINKNNIGYYINNLTRELG